MSWTHAQCESCWISQRGQRVDGRLIAVPRPITVNDGTIERCAWCGELTIIGLYVRADPGSVPYPSELP